MNLVREHLTKMALEASPLEDEDYEIGDGGNHNDTFEDGMKAGRIELARILLDLYFDKE